MLFNRFAIYFVPPINAPWARFASGFLGWDIQTGKTLEHPVLSNLPVDVAKVTVGPRKYGLHATLKPPFRLADGVTRDDLNAACTSLSRSLAPLQIGPLRLTRLGRFLALCPSASDELTTLAAACVRDPDALRAPATQQELERRNAANLTPRQQANLKNWGYPYVMDDFRFHITLTSRLSKPDLNAVETVLEQLLSPLLPPNPTLGDLALTGEDPDGRFHLLQRFPLSG